jgi:hypothetical protein
MKLRKRKRTFETTSKRVYELRSQIENAKMELAEELAYLEQYKVDVEVTNRTINDELGVKPMFKWQADAFA